MRTGVAVLCVLLGCAFALVAATDYHFDPPNGTTGDIAANLAALYWLPAVIPIGTLGAGVNDRVFIDSPATLAPGFGAFVVNFAYSGVTGFNPNKLFVSNALIKITQPGQIRGLAGGLQLQGSSDVTITSDLTVDSVYLNSGGVVNATGGTSILSGGRWNNADSVFPILVQAGATLALNQLAFAASTVSINVAANAVLRITGRTVFSNTVNIAGEGTTSFTATGLVQSAPISHTTTILTNVDVEDGCYLRRVPSSQNVYLRIGGGKTITIHGGAKLDLSGGGLSLGSIGTPATANLVIAAGSGPVLLNATSTTGASAPFVINTGAGSTITVAAGATLAFEYTGTANGNAISAGSVTTVATGGAITAKGQFALLGTTVFQPGSSLSVTGSSAAATTLQVGGQGEATTFVDAWISTTNGATVYSSNGWTPTSTASVIFNGTQGGVSAGGARFGGYVQVNGIFNTNGPTIIQGNTWYVRAPGGIKVNALTNVSLLWMDFQVGTTVTTNTGDLVVSNPSGSAGNYNLRLNGAVVASTGAGRLVLGPYAFGSSKAIAEFVAGTTNWLQGAKIEIGAQGVLTSSPLSFAYVTAGGLVATTTVTGSGVIDVSGDLVVQGAGQLSLSVATTAVSGTGTLRVTGGASIWVQAGASILLRGGELFTNLADSSTVQVQAGGAISAQYYSGSYVSWIGGNVVLNGGALQTAYVLSSSATLLAANDTMVLTGEFATGWVSVAASTTFGTGPTYTSGVATGSITVVGVPVTVSGTIVANAGKDITFEGYFNATANATVASVVTIASAGTLSGSAYFRVGTSTSNRDYYYSNWGARLFFAGTTLAPSTFSGKVWAAYDGEVNVAAGATVQVYIYPAWYGGNGVFKIAGTASVQQALTLNGYTVITGTIAGSGSGKLNVYGSVTVLDAANVTFSSGTTPTINVTAGGLLQWIGTGVSRIARTTIGVSSDSTVRVASTTTLLVGAAVQFGATGVTGSIQVDGKLAVEAAQTVTAPSAISVNGGTLELGVESDLNGASIHFYSGSTLSMKAHASRGFVALDFTGACALAGTFKVDLNGYVPTSRVRLATFGAASTTLSGRFTSSITGNSADFATSRRLLASSSGNVVYEGNVAYYDPDAEANSAASSSASVVLASIAALVALFIARF